MATDPPSARVLEALAGRASRFLTAATRQPAIFLALTQTCGYNKNHHQEGLRLLSELLGLLPPGAEGAAELVVDNEAIEAFEACDEKDGPLLERLEGALQLRFPSAWERLCGGLKPETGASAVVSLRVLLNRHAELLTSTDPSDQAALQCLAERGLGPDYFEALRKLVEKAESFDVQAADPGSWAQQYHAHQLALYVWWKEWSTNARRHITNRRHLISLGLATRRVGADGKEEIVITSDNDAPPPTA